MGREPHRDTARRRISAKTPARGGGASGEGTFRKARRKTPLLRSIGRLNADRQYSETRRRSFAGLSCKIITKPIKRIWDHPVQFIPAFRPDFPGDGQSEHEL